MFRPVAILLVLLLCIPPANGEDSSPVTLDLIVKTLLAREKALTSYEIQGRSFVSDEKGGRVPGSVDREFLYSQTNDGKRELREILIAPDGTRTVGNWIRDDGTKLYTMHCVPKSEHVVEYVVIEETPNQASRSVMPIIPYLNILSPRGKRLSDLVSTGQIVKFVKTDDNAQIVEVRVSDGGYHFDMQLSVKHDFMPREVRIVERDRKLVSTYRNTDGFWFPESGVSEQIDSMGSPLRIAFQIDQILVNPKKSIKDFSLPRLEKGTVIHNRTKTGPKGVFGVSNGSAAQERKAVKDLRIMYGSSLEPSNNAIAAKKLDMTAKVAPERSNLARVVLVLGASFALVFVVFLELRR